MRFRDHVALTLPPLLLRLALFVIFMWAGLGKILGETTVTGDDAARLARMGVQLDPVETPASPARALPGAAQPPANLPPPTDLVVPEPEDIHPADNASQPPHDAGDPHPEQPAATPVTPTTTDKPKGDQPAAKPLAMSATEPRWLPVQATTRVPTASDFPGKYTAQRLHGITLTLSKAADPGLDHESRPRPRFMPQWVGADRWPVYLAWAAAMTEILGAVMLFFGVLTRLGALMLVGVMLVAMWLTQFGPAIAGLTDAYLGFFPAADDPWSPASYSTLALQTACLVMGVAVMLLGSGPIGFDRALFRPSERLERADNNKRQRSTFDRGPTDTP